MTIDDEDFTAAVVRPLPPLRPKRLIVGAVAFAYSSAPSSPRPSRSAWPKIGATIPLCDLA
jgi:hypothetical protein